MVFHWSLSDNKTPQVSRTLLSILANLNNAVVWMVSTRHLISKSSSPITNPLVTVTSAPITIGINVTFMFNCFFSSQARLGTYLSFYFLLVLPCGQPEQHSLQFGWYFFLLTITRSGHLAEIRYLIIQYNFVCLILLDRFVCIIKFKFLAQFPVDHLTHLVVSSLLIIFLQLTDLVLCPLFLGHFILFSW